MARRQAVYFTLLGVAVGLLLAGLVVPLGFGGDQTEQFASQTEQSTSSGDARRRDLEDGEAAGSSRPGTEDGTAAPAPRGTVGPDSAADPSDGSSGAQDRNAGGGEATGTSPADGAEPQREDDVGEAGGAGQEGGSLGATDRGVTADSIKLGIMIFDLGGASELGVAVSGSDPEQQRRWWQAWVDDLNARGGIHGRQIDVHYYRYDLLSQDSQRAACREATQDDEVFAALDIGAIGPGTVLCFTRENRTPFVSLGSTGFTVRDFRRSEGFLFSMASEGQRMMANFAGDLDRVGELQEENALGETEDKAIGILSAQNPGTHDTVQRGLVDTLEQLGYEVTHWAELSGDTSTASSQVPVAVNQMRRKGVNAVLLLSGIFTDTQFVQEAESQQYFPDYYVTDWQGNWSETYASSMPDDFDGTLITTTRTGERRAEYPETPMEQECRRIYREQHGEELSRDPDSVEGWSSLFTCQVFRSFELGARAAGTDLTRVGFSRALQSLGEIPLATFGGGSFAPGKFGAADPVRTGEHDPDCGCWLPASEFREPRF